MIDIFTAITHGISVGLLLAIFVGPVFFVLLQTAIKKGFKEGALFAAGIITSDMMYFSLAFFGVRAFGPYIKIELLTPILGGLFVFGYGILLLFKDYRIHDENSIKIIAEETTPVRTYIKGFLVNTISPSGFVYWLGIVSIVHERYDGRVDRLAAFFIACMATVFGTDLIKSFYANKLKRVITNKVMFYINRVGGTILIIVGGYYIVKFIIIPYVHF